MIFEADNFIKEYLDTDKFITIQYPNGKRYMSINVSQNKKVTLNSKQISIYQEGRLPSNINFHSELEAQTAFSILNDAIDTLRNNTNNNINTFESVIKMKKHSSVTAEHIGLLAMQEVTVLTENPESVDDFQVQVKVADTVPATQGTKGEYTVRVEGIKLIKPETKIIRVYFAINPINDSSFVFYDMDGFTSYGAVTYKLPGQVVSGSNQIEIGNTVQNTIINTISWFQSDSGNLPTQYARVYAYELTPINEPYPYIDFEMRWLDAGGDYYKYMRQSFIEAYPDSFQNQNVLKPGVNLIDNFGNSVTIIVNNNSNIDGYYLITQIGNITDFNGEEFFTLTSDGLGSIYVNLEGVYYSIENLYRTEDGKLTLVAGSYTSQEIQVFPDWISSNNIFSSNTIRDLDLVNGQIAKNIYDATQSNFMLLSAQSWDTNNSSYSIINYANLFRHDSGQPNGEFGAFGLMYFQNNIEAVNALIWAINEENNLQQLFELVTAFENDSVDGIYKMTIRTLTAPSSQNGQYIYFSGNNVDSVICTQEETIMPEIGAPERIENTIVGKIVGVEGDNALISTAFIEELTMCSSEDGALGVLPLTASSEINFIPLVLAWRQGKVIDLAGYSTIMQNAGFGGDSIILGHMLIGGIFRPLTVAGANDKIIVDKRSYQFFD